MTKGGRYAARPCQELSLQHVIADITTQSFLPTPMARSHDHHNWCIGVLVENKLCQFPTGFIDDFAIHNDVTEKIGTFSVKAIFITTTDEHDGIFNGRLHGMPPVKTEMKSSSQMTIATARQAKRVLGYIVTPLLAG